MAVQTPLWLDLAAVFASAVMDALVAVRRAFDVVGVLALALVTGLGGGVIGDVLLRPGELYALTALAGIVLYVVLDRAGVKLAVGAALAVLVTAGLRLAAVRRGWRGPVPVDAVTSVRRSVSRRR